MMSHLKMLLIFIGIGIVLACSVKSQDSHYYWQYYIVDDRGRVGTNTTLLYGTDGLAQISYREADGKERVRHARQMGDSWQITTVDPGAFLGGGKVSMAINSANTPYIIYHVNACGAINIAWLEEGRWIIELLADGLFPNDCYDIDIDIDADDGIHVVYPPRNNDIRAQIVHTFLRSGSAPITELISDAGFSGKWLSLDLDNQNRPHIAFYQFAGANLGFARLDEDGWQVEDIEEGDFVIQQGFYPSIFINQDGCVYIVFQDQTSGLIKLATGSFHNWTVEDVVSLNGWTTFSTPNPLAVNQVAMPHIAFYDRMNKNLNMAFKLDGIWHVETVDTVGDVGEWASIAMTLDDLPAISYFDASQGLLKLAVGRLTPPADADQDGLFDYQEIVHGTNPLDADSDDDGLSDGEEDLNGNGRIDNNETDPLNADTDGDGLSDGLELGRQIGIPGTETILGTDPQLFFGDSDPNTRTDPLNPDTDGDGLPDGVEDSNRNGAVDLMETDPNLSDTDDDGLTDGLELVLGSDPLDLDSDDDGLSDFEEDENGNGVIDPGETSPLKFDSDGDGLGDGLEKGVTTGIVDPDGPGRLSATDLAVFIPDADYYKNSNPLNPDTDGDGLADGEEDRNQNGAVDPGETDFGNPDSDHDGQNDGDEFSFLSDPLDADSKADIQALYREEFRDLSLSAWQVIDQGDREGPSDWLIHDGILLQTSNIWGGNTNNMRADPAKPGTIIVLTPFQGKDYKVRFKMRSNDDDEIGILFRYQDQANHLRFSINREFRYARIVKMSNGQASTIAEREYVYTVDMWYDVVIYTIGERHQVFLDQRRIFDINESPGSPTSIAFYSWKNAGASFTDLEISGKGSVVGVTSAESNIFVNDFRLLEVYPNPTLGAVTIQFHTSKLVVIDYKVFDILGRLVRDFNEKTVIAGAHRLVWDGKDNAGLKVASGIYFFKLQVKESSESTGKIWQDQRKIMRLR